VQPGAPGWFHMADPRSDAEVTLRDMLSHRTGLKAKADLAALSHRADRARSHMSRSRSPGSPQNASVSATLANLPLGFVYRFCVPVCRSVTVSVYSTFDKAP
jgi:CubicO group peptidase (beta-lactamase class C family)